MAHQGYTTPVTKRRIRPGQVGRGVETGLLEIALIEGLGSIDGKPVTLDAYQINFMLCNARWRCVDKARQTGFSWIIGGESAARCLLRDNHTGNFVSYNLDDAKEKIKYTQLIYDSFPDSFKTKKQVIRSKTQLAWENPVTSAVSRVVSYPSKAPRGKGGDIYLDELAHYLRDDKVYMGSTALIARHPRAQMSVISTPSGRSGTFWAISRNETEKKYDQYYRMCVPWWLSRHYCKDVRVAAHDPLIWQMETDDRLKKYGRLTIHEQRGSLLLEDFQQEFECAYIDEAHSYYPWSLINRVTRDLELHDDSVGWDVSGRLYAGFDVGRKKDSSALVIVEEVDGHYFFRYVHEWHRMPFEDQKAILDECMGNLPIARLHIDATGIGIQLAESMVEQYGEERVRAESFTQQGKEMWAGDFKILMEKNNVTLPQHRNLRNQIHSIRKIILPGGKPRFDSEKNAKHHGDLYWAAAMACQKDRIGVEPTGTRTFTVKVVGG
jgi:phage FluMu gp28-like protein